MLEPVWVPDPETSGLRWRVARRAALLRQRTRAKNEIHATLARCLLGHLIGLQFSGPAGSAAHRLDRPHLIPVAVADRLARPPVSGAAEELTGLVLQRLPQDQTRSQPAGHLDRILLLADTGQHLIQF
jgi:transposase